ncbi:GPI inositol-deacylase [Arthrobacter sp. ISL-72]|uniref:GPI inositol-deacylase n=1 Tax=Arthrobacter sp. ISL-72 TaxID=2819114 RepID=UPI001BEC9CCB|nr:GPI inositol-deacylase [Arthrobacter sp. ISL-72]MBT2596048.1 hypothetical protein [Arthrobacter sp. ISL-72]
MALYGMDTESGRRLSEDLARASERLLSLRGSLTPLITKTPWEGPDGRKFHGEWSGHRQQLIGTAHALNAASNAVKRNVEEQLVASGHQGLEAGPQGKPDLPSLFDPLIGTLAGNVDDLWDGTAGFLSTVDESARAGWNLLRDVAPPPWGNLMDASDNAGDKLGHFGAMGWRWITEGEPPSVTEFASNTLLLAGATATLVITTGTMGTHNPHVFDDGRPVAGDPIRVDVGSGRGSDGRMNTPVPASISAIVQTTNAAYDDAGRPGTPDTGIRITTVQKPGEPPAFIVSIPGTTRWLPDGAGNATDLTGNLEPAGGNLSTAAEAVRIAMEQAGIPPGAPVMLSGHSQGGMIAVALAADGSFTDRFNVTNVVTYGSPVDSAPVPATIDVLALQHAGDPVPKLDLNDVAVGPGGAVSASPDNSAVRVTLPNPDVKPDIGGIGYHAGDLYAESAAKYGGSGPIAEYSQKSSTQQFLTPDPAQAKSIVSNVSRKQ